MTSSGLQASFDHFTKDMQAKYFPWLFNSPLLFSAERVDHLQRAQSVMLKLASYIVDRFDETESLLPIPTPTKELFHRLRNVPFKGGTFRTDFVIDQDNALKLIEVTCRFPLNGYFRSLALEALILNRGIDHLQPMHPISHGGPFLDHFVSWMGSASRLVVVLGEDTRDNESKYFSGLLRDADIDVVTTTLDTLSEQGTAVLDDAAIIAELTLDEWVSLPQPVLDAFMARPLLNDPRLVLLMHDKAFFSLPQIAPLMRAALTQDEGDFLHDAFAASYVAEQSPAIWDEAIATKDRWILKPRVLGRSVDIIAGALTGEVEWAQAVNKARDSGRFVLQRWHQSKQLTGMVGDEAFTGYFAGTLLYWDLNFFGCGMVRVSSHPISNVTDNRMAVLLTDRTTDPKSSPTASWI